MTPATSITTALPADTGPRGADHIHTAPEGALSLRRLYLLRFGYLFMGGGLAVEKWPSFVAHHGSWPLHEGIVECILLAMSLLALLGLRYPVKMLPILVFESLWKLTWLAVVAATAARRWAGHGHQREVHQHPLRRRRPGRRPMGLRRPALPGRTRRPVALDACRTRLIERGHVPAAFREPFACAGDVQG